MESEWDFSYALRTRRVKVTATLEISRRVKAMVAVKTFQALKKFEVVVKKFILNQRRSVSSSLKYVTLWKTSARSVQSFRFPLHYYQ